MSRKIEKILHEAAERDRKRILDDNQAFFDDVLMPKFEENRKEAAATKRHNRLPKGLRYGLTSLPLVVVLIVALTAVFTTLPAENGYLGPFVTEPSDIQKINSCLLETEMHGEFGSVILSTDQKSKKPMSFTISHEIVKDDSVTESTIELIIERSLTFDFVTSEYEDRIAFLSYEVKFNETATESTYDDVPVSEFRIDAYFDTGKERFYITYFEMSAAGHSTFPEYLAALIQPKK